MTFKEIEILGIQKAENFEQEISEKKEHNAKIDLLQKLSDVRDKYIEEGLVLELHGKRSRFTFKRVDQQNLEAILFGIPPANPKCIFYFANNEIDSFFTFSELKYVYTQLMNNKLYNKIYYKVLSDWILENCNTSIMELTKTKVYYGFSNEEIIKRTDEIYEQQKIHQ